MLNFKKVERYLFYALIFFLPWQTRIILKSFSEPFSEWNSAALYLTDIILLAVIFLWVWRAILKKEFNSPHPPLKIRGGEIVLFIFLAIGALSLFKAQNFWLGFYKEIKLIEMAGLFLYVKNRLSSVLINPPQPSFEKEGDELNSSLFKGRFGGILKAFVASGVLQALIAIGQFARQKSFGLYFLDESPLSPLLAGVAKTVVDGTKFIRAYGLTPHPNVLAAFLVVALFCLIYLLIIQYGGLSRLKMIFYFGGLFLLTSALFMTFSRAVMVIGLATIFCWLIYLKRKLHDQKQILLVILLFAVYCLILIAAMHGYFFERFEPRALIYNEATNLRVFYSKIAFKLIELNPFLGVGMGNFVGAMEIFRLDRLGLTELWIYQPVHNIYLLIAAENGIFGLLAFLAFLFFVIKPEFRNKQGGFLISGLLFLIIGLLITGLFDHFFWTLQQGQLMLWIMLGILAGFVVSPYSSTDRAQPSEG